MTVTTRIVHRRGALHRRSRARAQPRTAGWQLPVLGVVALMVFGAIGGAGLVGATTLGVMSAGLPPPTELDKLGFDEPTIVYDRAGKVELGRFEDERRRVLAFDAIPKTILDATTSAEDRTFWQNAGVDVPALVSAVAENASGASDRGASTITQQLVRARLLPEDVVQAGADRYVRKVKEIIQALRVNEAYPGESGKERVITAYLNEIFYGHGAYGIAAAAEIYFGVHDLSKLTIAQAALLAGLPKSPTTLDPYRYAKRDKKGRLVVAPGSPPLVRRDWVLGGMAATARWDKPDAADAGSGLQGTGHPGRRPAGPHPGRPVHVAGQAPAARDPWPDCRPRARRLSGDDDARLAGAAARREVARRGGDHAEHVPPRRRTVLFARRGSPRPNARGYATCAGRICTTRPSWPSITATATSSRMSAAPATRATTSRAPSSNPSTTSRATAPASQARPGNRSSTPAAFDAKRLTPGSLLLDVTTEFDRAQDWAPRDADQLERGPVLVRKALQYSLNIPAIRALQRVGNERVATTAEKMGIRFAGGRQAFLQAGLAGALGTVEVRPLDLTSAYGTIANGGVRNAPRMVLEVRGPDGKVVWQAPKPQGTRAVSSGAAYAVTDILAGNTDPSQNDIWAAKTELRGPDGKRRRPAAVKTGTTNDARDLGTYGFLPPTKDGVGLVVGVWMGNSDHSFPRAAKPATSLTAAAPLWRAFMREYTKKWPVTSFRRPKDVVQATIDKWSGGKPGPWTHETTKEWFVRGTQPGAAPRRRPTGPALPPLVRQLARRPGPGRARPVRLAGGRRRLAAAAPMAARASGGRLDSATAYFWHERSWGGQLAGSCAPRRIDHHGGGGNGGGHGDGNGHGKKDDRRNRSPPGPALRRRLRRPHRGAASGQSDPRSRPTCHVLASLRRARRTAAQPEAMCTRAAVERRGQAA